MMRLTLSVIGLFLKSAVAQESFLGFANQFGVATCGGGGGGGGDDGNDDGGAAVNLTCGANSYVSPFDELEWETGCGDYDFHATLYFCEDGDFYGYRLNEDDDCTTGMSPLIRMQAGKSYQLRLWSTASTDTFTNLHTHGLHIPGAGNADDVTRHVRGGMCLFYNWTLPANHMDGTFWYHSHIHEHTNEQVNGGALGMLLVDEVEGATEVRPDWVYNTDNERLLFLSSVVEGGGRDAIITDYVNGDDSGEHVVDLNTNQWHRLRISVADAEAGERDITFDSSVCQTHIVAQDGVWRNQVPKPATSTVRLSGANRVDIAIRCSASSGLWYRTTSTNGAPHVHFRVCDADTEDSATLEAWTPERPDYLLDMRSAVIPADTFSIFEIDGRRGINGRTWSMDVALNANPTIPIMHDSDQQWTLSDTGQHPFHLHLYHFQIVTPGGCGNYYDEGEWFDSVTASRNEDCTVRFHTEGVGGRTVMHCHILRHEDDGVIGWVQVDGAPPHGDVHVEPTATCAAECYA